MKPPFPGMDPYLEHPELWPDVHNALIAETRNVLGPLLRPRYVVCLEERAYLSDPDGLVLVGRPDLAFIRTGAASAGRAAAGASQAIEVELPVPDPVRETYLVVRETRTGEIVTLVELLSPGNKRPGEGRTLYEQKRRSVLQTATNLVEIDLLRAGQRMPLVGPLIATDYTILIRRGERISRGKLLPFGVRDRIPLFALPLYAGDPEPDVNLGAHLAAVYEAAAYDLRVDYHADPVPPLAGVDRTWSDRLLRKAKLR